MSQLPILFLGFLGNPRNKHICRVPNPDFDACPCGHAAPGPGYVQSVRNLGSWLNPGLFMVLAHLLYGNACAKGATLFFLAGAMIGALGMCRTLKTMGWGRGRGPYVPVLLFLGASSITFRAFQDQFLFGDVERGHLSHDPHTDAPLLGVGRDDRQGGHVGSLSFPTSSRCWTRRQTASEHCQT